MMCSTLSLLGAERVRLYGTVTDEVGQPLEMVHIRLTRGAIGTLSSFKGEYTLDVPDSDTLRVIFTSLGYKRVEQVVNTRAVTADAQGNRRLMLNVQMHTNQAYINDVEVTAQRQQIGTVEHLAVENISTIPTTSGNAVEDMLGTMAGVTMNNELSSQYSVRGGSFDENLVYINGIEVYRPQLIASGQQEGLSMINPAMVGQVDFSTGGFAAEYGDKMSSVLDITYRVPEKLEGSAEVNFMGAAASLGQRTRKFTQLHGARFRRNASLLSGLDTKGEYDPSFFDYQTFLTYVINDNWGLSFLGNIATNHYKFAPETRETSFGTMDDPHHFKVYFDGHEKDEFDTYFGALTLTCKGIRNTVLQAMLSAYATDEEVTYDISGEYWLDEATEGGQSSLGVGAYHEHARNYLNASVEALQLKGTTQVKHHKLQYGLTLQSEHIDDRIAEWERRDSSGYTLPHTGTAVQMIYNLHSFYRKTTLRTSLFAQDSYSWNAWQGRMNLIAGFRLSHWSYNGETLFSPRASLRYTPDSHPTLSLRLATGLYYQAPFYKEYRENTIDSQGNTMVRMNADIRSQRSWQLVLGSDYTFDAYGRPFKFTAEAYVKTISDYIPYTVDNVQIRYLGHNAGHATNCGLDFKIFGQFVPGTDSWLSLSLMEAKETYAGLKTARPTEQRYSVGLFFSDFWPGNENYRVYLRGVFNDGLPFSSPIGGREAGIFRTPSYKRVDLGANRVWNADNARFMRRGRQRANGSYAKGWTAVREMNVGIDIFNLLDIDNTNSYYWVTAVDNRQFAVPNYLTGRMLSLHFGISF